MAITLEQLNIKIAGNSTDASASVDQLTDSLKNLRSEAKEMASYGNAVNAAIKGMNKAAGGGAGSGNGGKYYREVKEEATGATSAIEGYTEATSHTATATTSASKAQESFNKDLRNTKEEAGKATKEVSKHSSGIGNLMSSLKRIAFYRLIRSAIKEITQAVVEGTQAFIEWDRANGGVAGAAQATDELKAAWDEVKGAIGAAGGALITLVKPVIEFIADVVITIVNGIQMIIRGLQGETTYFKKIRKEATATTAAAKELKRVLFGFDELNVLPSQNGGGISGGGSNEYVEEEIPDWIQGIYGFFDKLERKGDDTSKELQKDFSDAAEKSGAKARKEAKDTGNAIRTVFGEVLGGAELDIKKLNNYVHKNPITIPVNAYVPVTTITSGVDAAKRYADNNPVSIGFVPDLSSAAFSGAVGGRAAQIGVQPVPLKFTVGADGLNGAIEAASYASKAISFAIPAIEFKTHLDTSGATSALNSWMSEAQKFLSNNPLKIFIKQISSGSSTSSTIQAFSPDILVSPNAARPVAGSGGGGKVLLDREPQALPTPQSAVPRPAVGSGGGGKVLLERENTKYSPSAKQLIADALKDYEATQSQFADIQDALEKLLAGGMLGGFLGSVSGLLSELGIGSLAGVLGFANGGNPDMGTLFYAGERGPEVVANMGNHQSGVMNVMQMQAAMEGANEGIVGAVVAMSNAVVNAIKNKDTNVYMDTELVSRKITRAQINTARRFGEGMA